MNQNDISKRHQNDILDIQRLFSNSADQTLYSCAQKLGKIAAAVHLVADIMDDSSALASGLYNKSLGATTACYACVGKSTTKADDIVQCGS
jgi:hypothetical protein